MLASLHRARAFEIKGLVQNNKFPSWTFPQQPPTRAAAAQQVAVRLGLHQQLAQQLALDLQGGQVRGQGHMALDAWLGAAGQRRAARHRAGSTQKSAC